MYITTFEDPNLTNLMLDRCTILTNGQPNCPTRMLTCKYDFINLFIMHLAEGLCPSDAESYTRS